MASGTQPDVNHGRQNAVSKLVGLGARQAHGLPKNKSTGSKNYPQKDTETAQEAFCLKWGGVAALRFCDGPSRNSGEDTKRQILAQKSLTFVFILLLSFFAEHFEAGP